MHVLDVAARAGNALGVSGAAHTTDDDTLRFSNVVRPVVSLPADMRATS